MLRLKDNSFVCCIVLLTSCIFYEPALTTAKLPLVEWLKVLNWIELSSVQTKNTTRGNVWRSSSMYVQLCENKNTTRGHRQCTFSSVKTKNKARQRVEVIVNARSAYMRTLYSWLGVCHDNGLIMLWKPSYASDFRFGFGWLFWTCL